MGETLQQDLKLSILYPLVHYVAAHFGQEALERGAELAGVGVAELASGKSWAATGQVEAFCGYVDDLVHGDESEFRRACAFHLARAYGPLRFVLWATSPRTVLGQAAANLHLVSTHGHYELTDCGADAFEARYTSARHESRLLCILRQVNITAMPTFWGLPQARLEETSCIAHGAEACLYRVHWAPSARRWPVLAWGVVAALCGWFVASAGLGSFLAWPLLLGVGGGLAAQLRESHRVARQSLEFARESHQAIERLARDEREARTQLAALTLRQEEWTAATELQLAQRTSAMEKIIATVEQTQRERVTALRGMSHDLRSPLTVLYGVAEYARIRGLSADDPIIGEQISAVERMEGLLRALMESVVSDGSAQRPAERIEISQLAPQLRGQLRALVFGKDIRVSVFCSRDAPESVMADRLLFSRILDNLLSNAAKYTERGSIVVELDGQGEFLSVKISDSGRGIPTQHLEQVFGAGASPVETRAADSYGVGLSVVVRLLADVRGWLEVMSKEGVGTTFWVFFPVSPVDIATPGGATAIGGEGQAAKVVKIRQPAES